MSIALEVHKPLRITFPVERNPDGFCEDRDAMLCDSEVVPQLFLLGNVFIGLMLAWQQAKGSLMHNPSQCAEFASLGTTILPLIGQLIAHQVALSSCPGPLRLIPFC